ncbi:hypothetical protein [Winogradskyella flava]|uniref:Adhesin domain-containing protein n=1 Tax=Winogradskyella flava TaxID=1884876 RepID=A0A842IW82_9FLAO|nr:hypothetical protein [Winogradskyella flava]MBC2845973.1 hypothetical protein [Winogradskyella flava]
MKTQFKCLVLMLIISALNYAQSHQILKKSFEVDKNTSVVLNFENIYVAIEESTDGKIHFDYAMEFEGYSKKAIQEKLKEITAEVSNFDNGITLMAKSKNQITFARFELKTDHGLYIEDDLFSLKKDSIIRKAKDSLLAEIRYNNRLDWSKSPLKYINGRFKKMDKDGNLSNIRKGNVDILRSKFLIKVPPFVKLNINAVNAGLYFRNDMQNELSASIKKGTLKTKGLLNAYNVLRVDNANFEAESISGGTYNFKNVKNGKIGSTQEVNIDSEFSKIEIGEINKSTTITDFNSEYWFYNWAHFFDRFNLYSEYTKIHFFYPDRNHSLKVVGNNTKNLFGNGESEINMQPTRKGEKYTMMTREPHPGETLSGRIFFDIIHGIIYSHNDSIKTINKN